MDVKMTDEQLKNITDMNFRVLTLLGYSMAILSSLKDHMNKEQLDKYISWKKSVNNVIYFDKPMELL